MSAAVSSLPARQTSPHITARAFPFAVSSSRMGPSATADSKKHVIVHGASDEPNSGASRRGTGPVTPPRSLGDPPSTTGSGPDRLTGLDAVVAHAELAPPLAPPPPRPAPSNVTDPPDYFSAVHHGSHFALEPNPFEQSFGNPSAETPGKSVLPPVAALASPATLGSGAAASAAGLGWPHSLRAGPLSPAMLAGPAAAAAADYFDGQLRASFPTPHESSLRTGLTPGGGGSMFPAASPNSQALFQQLAGTAASTPGTLDFHRTALSAAAMARKSESISSAIDHGVVTTTAAAAITINTTTVASSSSTSALLTSLEPSSSSSAPTLVPVPASGDDDVPAGNPADASTVGDPFGAHDANDAANGLFLLARARDGGSRSHRRPVTDSIADPDPLPTTAHDRSPRSASPGPSARTSRSAAAATAGDLASHGRSDSVITGVSERGGDVGSEGAAPATAAIVVDDRPTPNGRRKGRTGSGPTTSTVHQPPNGAGSAKGHRTTTARRKADDSPTTTSSKGPARKKSRASVAQPSASERPSESADDDDLTMAEMAEMAEMMEMGRENGRKMTDDEKRKNFLERNRVAALKCRQRKKQWLANLQAKVEIFSSENDALSAQVTQLREEVVNLKTLLLAHKDCPISQAQGIAFNVNGLPGEYNGAGHPNPYGMAMATAAGSIMAGRGLHSS